MKKIIYIFLFAIVIGFFLAPFVYLFSIPDLASFEKVWLHANTLKAIENTFIVAISVGILCTILGLPLAWILTRTDLKYKSTLRSWFCLPYAIPPFVGAIGWIILANPSSGILNQWFKLNLNIYSFSGLIFVEVSFLFTFVLLTALSVMDNLDSSLEEAAKLSGAKPLQVFRHIVLPLLKPALITGFVLSSLATAASFGVPALIGGPARIYLMTTQIFNFQRLGTAEGLQLAIATSVILAMLSLIVLYVNQLIMSRNKINTVGGKSSQRSYTKLHSWNNPLLAILTSILFVIFILPIAALLLSALSPIQGSWNFSELSLINFKRVLFETDETGRAILQSLFLGSCAAVISTVFAFFFNYFVYRTKWIGRNIASVLMSVPFTIPGTVVSLAVILSFSRGYFGFGPSPYNTLWIILIAYIIKYMSLGVKTVGDGYQQINVSLEEAARISGANWWQVMITIYWPLLKSSLVASLFLIFMPVVSELTMTVLLTGPGLETLGPLIFQFQEYSDIGGGGAAVLSVLVVALILLLNFSLKKVSQGRYGL